MLKTFSARIHRFLTAIDPYRQALVAAQSDPSVYKNLPTPLQNRDAKNNHSILRAAAKNDPAVIALVHNADTIPGDLLCRGMESEYVWRMILSNWGPYTSTEFATKYPEEVALIHFYKQMELPPDACAHYYKVWRYDDIKPDFSPESVTLPSY